MIEALAGGNAVPRAHAPAITAETLRSDLLALRDRLGHLPTVADVKSFVASRGLSRREMELLADAVTELHDLPAASASAGPSATTMQTLPSAQRGRETTCWHGSAPVTVASAPPVPVPAEPTIDLAATSQPGPDDNVLGPTGTAAPTDKLVRRCVEDLVDDWHRTGGVLLFEDFSRIVSKRQLTGSQAAAVRIRLAENGIEIGDSVHTRGPASTDDDTVLDLDVESGSSDPVRDYLKAIGRHKLLYAEDEVRLANEIRAGVEADETIASAEANGTVLPHAERRALRRTSRAGKRAHDAMVEANLRLVVSIAKQSKYALSGLSFLDLVQEGNIGLMRAVDKFDPTIGTKFSTYATWWIRQRIERGIADTARMIRLPVHVEEKVRSVMGVRAELGRRLGRTPSVFEVAEEAQLDASVVHAMLDWSQPVGSLDSVVDEDGTRLVDFLAVRPDASELFDPVRSVMLAAKADAVGQLLSDVLTDRERFVVERRFGFDGADLMTLDAIGALMGVTRERVRQLQTKAFTKLRAAPQLRDHFGERFAAVAPTPEQAGDTPEPAPTSVDSEKTTSS